MQCWTGPEQLGFVSPQHRGHILLNIVLDALSSEHFHRLVRDKPFLAPCGSQGWLPQPSDPAHSTQLKPFAVPRSPPFSAHTATFQRQIPKIASSARRPPSSLQPDPRNCPANSSGKPGQTGLTEIPLTATSCSPRSESYHLTHTVHLFSFLKWNGKYDSFYSIKTGNWIFSPILFFVTLRTKLRRFALSYIPSPFVIFILRQDFTKSLQLGLRLYTSSLSLPEC